MSRPRHSRHHPEDQLYVGRDRALDGLRGVAAADVVVHHFLLISASYSAIRQIAPHALSAQDQALRYSPLELGTRAGPAVWIFFILSGFVLTRPYLRGRTMRPLRYYSQRMVRLYLPLLASGLFAVILFDLVWRRSLPGMSLFMTQQSVAGSVKSFFESMLVVGGNHSTGLNPVWWSLQWEVIFSLLLPLVVIVMRPLQRLWGATIAMMIACSALGSWPPIVSKAGSVAGALKYLPMFFIGVALVGAEAPLRRWVRSGAGSVALPVGCLAVLCASWLEVLWLHHGHPSSSQLVVIQAALVLSGATAVMVLALTWAPFDRVLTTRPVHWLGQRSFSLYLAHVPVVATLAFALHLESVTVLLLVLAIPLVLLATEAFYKIVEVPTLRLIARMKAHTSSGSAPSVAAGHQRDEIGLV